MKYIAFLRAINVGGRNIKMNQLRSHFTLMGYDNVNSFIASGNVIFSTEATDRTHIENKIETNLGEKLGYEVTTFIRHPGELNEILNYKPFGKTESSIDGNKIYVGFLKKEPGEKVVRDLLDLKNEVDDFVVNGKEVYWLRRTQVGRSDFSGSVLEKTLGMEATIRNLNTVRRIMNKFF